MATLQRVCSPCVQLGCNLRSTSRSRPAFVVRAQANQQEQSVQARIASLSVAASTLFAAGNVHAATELVQIADNDGRLGILSLIFLPALGWVAFNIAGPALNQLNSMDAKKGSFAVGLGLTAASLLAAANANAGEVAQIADSDNRVGIIALLFLPVVGWVGFNILQPALNQLGNMSAKTDPKAKKRRGVAVGLGLTGASLLSAYSADAATEVMQIAERDGRLGILSLIFLPALGWVAFNILGPAKNQLDKMAGSK